MNLPDIPLSPEAAELLRIIGPRIDEHLAELARVPVSVLLWGPAPDSGSPLAIVRTDLRTLLRKNGHAAFYGEELCQANSTHSIRLQQLAQAQEFDLIVSTPCTPGSVGEIHDFAADRRVHSKILVFLNDQQVTGYSAQSLVAIQSLISCHIEYYPGDCSIDRIVEVTMNNVQRIRETKYILKGRY